MQVGTHLLIGIADILGLKSAYDCVATGDFPEPSQPGGRGLCDYVGGSYAECPRGGSHCQRRARAPTNDADAC